MMMSIRRLTSAWKVNVSLEASMAFSSSGVSPRTTSLEAAPVPSVDSARTDTVLTKKQLRNHKATNTTKKFTYIQY
jgi:hypothetical protein